MVAFLENSWLALVLAAVTAYLLGSVNFAIVVTRAFAGKDIRSFGSGNAGATNVLRSQGLKPALLTFFGDLAKSMVSVALGGWFVQHIQLSPATAAQADLLMYNTENLTLIGCHLAAVFCLLGHLYPLFFGFRGGKGVMTTLGMLLLLDWASALVMIAVFGIFLLITRMVSAGSLAAAVVMPILTYLARTYVYDQEWPTVAFCTVVAFVISVTVIIKHRENIKRIWNGTESKAWGNK